MFRYFKALVQDQNRVKKATFALKERYGVKNTGLYAGQHRQKFWRLYPSVF